MSRQARAHAATIEDGGAEVNPGIEQEAQRARRVRLVAVNVDRGFIDFEREVGAARSPA